MEFVPSNCELFENTEYKAQFDATLKEKIKASGHPDTEFDFLHNYYQNDKTIYSVPDSISADRLAAFYYSKVHDQIENHIHNEVDNHLYEVSSRSHTH